MSPKKDPLWLTAEDILAVHDKLLSLHGGSPGLRDLKLLDSALARPRHLHTYEAPDQFALAASYADGIINNHPFIDGNKRTGFITAALFLETNGLEFNASEEEAVTMTRGLADKSVAAADYARWLTASCKRRKTK